MTTELNPTTHAPVNHDAARRQRELDYIMSQVNKQDPAASEVPATQAPLSHMVSVDDPSQVVIPVQPIEQPKIDWQAEAEKNRKRHQNAEQALTPALQKAALLTNQLKEERETNAAMFLKMQEQLAEMKAMMSQPRHEDVAPVYRPEDDPEFASDNPAVAERLALLTKSFNQRLDQFQKEAATKIAAIEERHLTTQKAVEQERQQLYIQNWDKELRRLVPDIDSFMPGGAYGQSLVEWTAPIPEYAQAVGNPYSYTPLFVASIITGFKTANGITPVNGRRPSLGDIANPALTGSSRVAVEPSEPAQLLSDYEMANIKDLVDKAFREKNHTLGNDLLARYEKTLQLKQR